MIYRRFVLLVVMIGITAVIVACGGAAQESAPEAENVTGVITDEMESAPAEESAAESVVEPPLATGSEGVGDDPPAPETGEKVAVTRVASEIALADAPVVEAVEIVRAEGDTDHAVAEESLDSTLPLDQNSRLTAGEVDDNAEWDDYVKYLRNYQGAAVIPVDVSERHQIWVQDSQGHPVLGAVVEVEADGEPITKLRTHSNGRSFFFPRAFTANTEDYVVTVTVNNQAETFTIPAGSSQREWFITHPGADQRQQPQTRLDVLFLIDATGSMSDEINQLKENIRAISARIDGLPSQPDVRFGMVTYRDHGDEYITQVTDFTPKVEDFAGVLAQVYANGGGDYPEDLNEALSQAVHRPEWRVEDTVSLIFLVADAPPHLDYGQQNHYADEMLQAATRGIKIYPIASSGLDEQGEYIFRQLAQTTGGRFIFLTYGEDGPGSTGTETEFEVSDYTVSSLDDMVIQIVEEELAPLSR
ncbi:MAG: VWA domain-containing protein [Anaerolineae bacterium]|nr:VWA domain-containing protein [Anaerolineae bacterium]